MIRTAVLAGVLLVAAAGPAAAQGVDTMTLAEALSATRSRDPRLAQVALERSRSDLRLGRITADRQPSVRLSAQAQYQSDVTSLEGALPGPIALPTRERDTYDARIDVRQPLFDPTIGSRRAAERAGLAESEARIEVALHTLRQEVIETFFGAALLQARREAIEATVAGLEAAIEVADARVREGTALRSEAAQLRAELLNRRQEADAVRAERNALLLVLGELSGVEIDSSVVLETRPADGDLPDSVSRPELRLFGRSRDRVAMQERALAATDLPRVFAFGRAGYGRPGLNLLSEAFSGWWLGGVQLEWSPRLWGSEHRERELLRIEAEIISTEEAAFRESVTRARARERATIERMTHTLALDDEIVRLREAVAQETRLRFGEGVVTAAELVDRDSAVLSARIARASHILELARARARYLNLLGLEVN
jgi:outer membrane protein TolC